MLRRTRVQGSRQTGPQALSTALTLLVTAVLLTRLAGAAARPLDSGARGAVPLQTLVALQEQAVVRQTADYSCGAAALATLLTYGLGDRVTEHDILRAALAPLPQDEVAVREQQGLSLADLQRVAQERGHKAQGFRVPPGALLRVQGPVLVFLKAQGAQHFTVLQGIRGPYAYLADPSVGHLRLPLPTFFAMWLDKQGQGLLFVVERHDGAVRPDSPLLLAPE